MVFHTIVSIINFVIKVAIGIIFDYTIAKKFKNTNNQYSYNLDVLKAYEQLVNICNATYVATLVMCGVLYMVFICVNHMYHITKDSKYMIFAIVGKIFFSGLIYAFLILSTIGNGYIGYLYMFYGISIISYIFMCILMSNNINLDIVMTLSTLALVYFLPKMLLVGNYQFFIDNLILFRKLVH